MVLIPKLFEKELKKKYKQYLKQSNLTEEQFSFDDFINMFLSFLSQNGVDLSDSFFNNN